MHPDSNVGAITIIKLAANCVYIPSVAIVPTVILDLGLLLATSNTDRSTTDFCSDFCLHNLGA